MTLNGADVSYLIRSGLLTLSAALPSGKRLILALLYPGDLVRPDLLHLTFEGGLSAVSATEVLRIPKAHLDSALAGLPELCRDLRNRMSGLQLRLALRAEVIGLLSGEERVAAFFIEMAQRLGPPAHRGAAFVVPLSRADIADYLALNPDTLSRHISRLRQKGVLQRGAGGRVFIRDWEALCRECPIAPAIRTVHECRG